MLKDQNGNARTRWEISSKLTIKTNLVLMSLLSTLHISHVIVGSLLLTLSRKMFARNPCYESSSTLEQNDVIALLSVFLIVNIFHTLF